MESSKRIYLGLDVSKGYVDVALYSQQKERLVKGVRLYDLRAGHQALRRQLLVWREAFGADQIICGVESTGGYENNWYRSLRWGFGLDFVEVYRLNPLQVKYQGQSEGRRTITDSVSAQTICLYLIEKYEQIRQAAAASLDDSQARKFYHYLQKMTQQQTRWSNQLEKLVYDTFPELIAYLRAGFPSWVLELLRAYPTSGCIRRAQPADLLQIKGVTRQRAEAIQAQAAQSVGLADDPFLAQTIRGLSRQLLEWKRTLAEEKAYLVQHYTSPQVELLSQIKGVGRFSAIGAMMEIEDVRRFASASSLAAYFGLHPEFKQSGDGKTQARMSKKGRSSYRAILYMAARNVVLHNDYFKEIYARFRAKGMKDGPALGVIMNKLTRVFYGVLKSATPFDPQIDQANQNKPKDQARPADPAPEQELKEEWEQLREAPCSNRALKRKKAEVRAHTSSPEVGASSRTST